MAFCANCGSEVQGRFCSKCGATVAPAAGAPQGSPPPGGASYSQPQGAPYSQPQGTYAQPQAPGLEENVAAALCYALGVLSGIVFLVLAPYNQNKLIRFHAFQSIFVWVGLLVGWIGVFIVSFILVLIPGIGPALSTLISAVFGLAVLALWILLMYKAYNREKWVLPVIGPLAEKQA